MEERRPHADLRVRREPQAREPGREHLQRGAHLFVGQAVAGAGVQAAAEREMAYGRAGDGEDVGPLDHRLAPAGGTVGEEHLGALGEFGAGQDDRAGGDATEAWTGAS